MTATQASFRESSPSSSRTRIRKKRTVPYDAWKQLDRVQVLEGDYGHDGCVNALSWIDQETLASSGDDTRVHLWRMSSTDEYDFSCTGIIRTGHRNNIFNVKLLPSSSSHIVTCARDRQVRVFDASRARDPDRAGGAPVMLNKNDACIRVFKCHDSEVKRLVVDGPYQFMSVSGDGTVRHHDLRQAHTCSEDGCPSPLIRVDFSLDALTMSSLRPYYLAVAGESPYGFLFDRRGSARNIRSDWGIGRSNGLTTCVRRFGRRSRRQTGHSGHHITGARLSDENSEELLLSYHGDSVYRYSIFDEPTEAQTSGAGESTLQSPHKRRRTDPALGESSNDEDAPMDEATDDPEDEWTDDDDDDEDEPNAPELRVPVILPRTRYQGACNIQTVKDVNFVGHLDEYVVSGSDDGNWFMWDKQGTLQGIWEGDSTTVNVIESHPSLPLVAVSGIDDTVKIFAPTPGENKEFSRMSAAADIVSYNITQAPRPRDLRMADLLRYGLLLQGSLHDQHVPECPQQ